jgi:hypothetical protein
MRALSHRAFSQPELGPDAPIQPDAGLPEQRRQADASHTAALCRAREDHAARKAGTATPAPAPWPLDRSA